MNNKTKKIKPETETLLRRLCMEQKTNKEIAAATGLPLADVHAWRSRNNLTRAKVDELLKKEREAEAITADAAAVTTTIDEGFCLPKVEKFEELINERTKAILICNPNNPTGYLYTQKEMNQIRDLVKKHNLYLFSDEVYREFIYTGSPYISSMHLEGIEQNVVLIDSVSKRYSECGIRIGALITKNEAIRSTVMKFCQARLSPPLIGQIVAEASIDGTEAYSREIYEEYVERRKCLIDGVKPKKVVNQTRMVDSRMMVPAFLMKDQPRSQVEWSRFFRVGQW